MKKIAIMIACIGAGTLAVHASVVLSHTGDTTTGPSSVSWTVSDLGNTPPSISGPNNPGAAGSFTAGAGSFGLTYTAATNWSATAAQSAITGGTFGTYLDGLNANDAILVGSTRDAFYTQTPSNDDGWMSADEVFMIEINTDSLTSGTLKLEQVHFANYGADDYLDFLVYDSSSNTVVQQQWNQNVNGSDAVSGSWTLETGDMVIMGVGASGAGGYRQNTLTLDVIPEPATLGLIAFAGAGLMAFRRLRSI